jgi:hypothetical protein
MDSLDLITRGCREKKKVKRLSSHYDGSLTTRCGLTMDFSSNRAKFQRVDLVLGSFRWRQPMTKVDATNLPGEKSEMGLL